MTFKSFWLYEHFYFKISNFDSILFSFVWFLDYDEANNPFIIRDDEYARLPLPPPPPIPSNYKIPPPPPPPKITKAPPSSTNINLSSGINLGSGSATPVSPYGDDGLTGK